MSAADAPSDQWPDRPASSTAGQYTVPITPASAPSLKPDAGQPPPAATAPTPVAQPPPTQAVPTGERALVGPPISVSPADSAYEVDAPDYGAANHVVEMCDRFKALAVEMFTWPDKPMSRIQVQLVPAAKADFTGPYVLRPTDAGPPAVYVRWDGNTAFFDVCRAVSTVSLQNIVYANDGALAANRVPDWLVCGMAVWLESNVKPAELDGLVSEAHRYPMLAMRQIMSASAPTGPDVRILAVNAFWLATFLRDHSVNPAAASALFDGLAAGVDPAKLLVTAFAGQVGDPRDLELWWQLGYRDELASHAPPFEELAETRAVLDRLERIEIVQDNVPRLLPLDQAWASRAAPGVRTLIEKTLLAQQDAHVRANPAYKNAVVSVLEALDTMRKDDKKSFDTFWSQYQSDRALGEAVENAVNTAMTPDSGK